MSLIPSESLSFPDSFRAAVGWRLAKGPSPEHSHPELEAITATLEKEHPIPAGKSASTVIRREHVVLPQTRREEALSEETAMCGTEPVQLQLVAEPEPEVAQQTEPLAADGEFASTTRESEHVVALQTRHEEVLSEETSIRNTEPTQLQLVAQPESEVAQQTERSATGGESASTTEEQEDVLTPTWQEAPSPEGSTPADKTEPIQSQFVAGPSGHEAAQKAEAKIPARIPIVPRKHVARIHTDPASVPVVPRPKFRSLARTENSAPASVRNEVNESVAPSVSLPKESIAGDESQAIRTPPKSPVVKIAASRPGPFPAQIDLFPESERRGRWIRFIGGEIVGLACLIVLLRLAWTQQFADRAIVALLVIMITGAVAGVVTLPIIFVRNNPARWVRDR